MNNSFASSEFTAGQLNAIVKKLGGPEMAHRFLRGELLVVEAPRVWKVWKTIKLGTGLKTVNDFRKALEVNGCQIGTYAPGCKASETEIEIDLVRVTVGELGFKERTSLAEIYARAKALGLELCPPEVGPQLRLQYKDQPKGECLHVGMHSIPIAEGDLRVFAVVCADDGHWLHGRHGSADYLWSVDECLVFVLPRAL